jgi:hypothetical protein
MKDDISARYRFAELGQIADIAENELSVFRDVGIQSTLVNLRGEAVENADLMASFQQRVSSMRTDEARAPGYKYPSSLHLPVAPVNLHPLPPRTGLNGRDLLCAPECGRSGTSGELWMYVTRGEMSCERRYKTQCCSGVLVPSDP